MKRTEPTGTRTTRLGRLAVLSVVAIVVGTLGSCNLALFFDPAAPNLSPMPGTFKEVIEIRTEDRNDYDYYVTTNPDLAIGETDDLQGTIDQWSFEERLRHRWERWEGDTYRAAETVVLRVFTVSPDASRSRIYELEYVIDDRDAPVASNRQIGARAWGYFQVELFWTGAYDEITSEPGKVEYAIYSSRSDDLSTYEGAAENGRQELAWTPGYQVDDPWLRTIEMLRPADVRWVNVFARDRAGNITAYQQRRVMSLPIVDVYVGSGSLAEDHYVINDGTGAVRQVLTGVTGLADIVYDLEMGDFDQDGFADLCVSYSDTLNDYVEVYEADGTGSFRVTPVWSRAVYSPALKIGDVDADGDLDLVYAEANTGVVLQKFNGFVPAGSVQVSTQDGSAAVGIGDVTGNGHKDVVAAHAMGYRLFEQSALGSFAEVPAAARAVNALTDVLVADVNRDQRADLVFTSSDALQLNQVLISTGAGSFISGTPGFWSDSDTSQTATLIDMYSDGSPDILIHDGGSAGIYSWDDGVGSFDGPWWTFSPGEIPIGYFVRDLNGDGHQDVAVLTAAGDVEMWIYDPGGYYFWQADAVSGTDGTAIAGGRLR